MKKILMLTPELQIGGAEKIITEIVLALKDKYSFSVASGTGYYSEVLKENNIRRFNLPSVQWDSITELLKLYLSIFDILQKEKPAIVHTHHRLLSFLVGLVPNTKFVHLHTMHCQFSDKRFLTYCVKPDHTIAVGRSVYKSLRETFHYPADKCSVIPNGVSIRCKQRAYTGQINKIVCIGRLDKMKGQQYLLEAISQINDEKIQVFFIGDGQNRVLLENRAEELGLSHQTFFLGVRYDIKELLADADLFVSASLSEGLPLVLIEALACAVPVIATDVGGTGELIVDHQTGLLIPAKSSRAIADAIGWARAHVTEIISYAKAGQTYVQTFFSMERMIRQYDQLYRSYLK